MATATLSTTAQIMVGLLGVKNVDLIHASKHAANANASMHRPNQINSLKNDIEALITKIPNDEATGALRQQYTTQFNNIDQHSNKLDAKHTDLEKKFDALKKTHDVLTKKIREEARTSPDHPQSVYRDDIENFLNETKRFRKHVDEYNQEYDKMREDFIKLVNTISPGHSATETPKYSI